MKISLTRKEYKKSKSIFDDEKDPNKKFKKWYRYAEKKVSEPNAFTLSTSINNKPSSRMMLLKGIDEDLVFYTNKIIEYLKNELARNKPKQKNHDPIQYKKDIKVLNYLIARSK